MILSEQPIIIGMNVPSYGAMLNPVLERMLAKAKQNRVLATRSTTMSADATTLEQGRPGYPSGALYAVEVRN